MTDNSKRAWDVAIWGTYPPPYGGMATHIVRLMRRMEQEDIRVRVFNRVSDAGDPPRAICIRHNQKRWFMHFALTSPDKLLYVFTGRPLVRFLAYALKLFRGKRYILRIGEERIFDTFRDGGWLEKWMTRKALCNADHVVAVSPHFCELLSSVGVAPEKIHVIPGFIAPADLALEPPQEVIDFAASHSPVLSANGQLQYSYDKDVYGFDILIDALKRLKEIHPNIGLLMSLYSAAGTIEGLDEFRQMLKDEGLADAVHIRPEPHVFWPTLKYSDIFVRPTRSEGDSASIRESISLGVPVVASNATPRPEPSVLFENDSSQDLCDKLSEVLADLPQYSDIFDKAQLEDNSKPIIDLIKSCLK